MGENVKFFEAHPQERENPVMFVGAHNPSGLLAGDVQNRLLSPGNATCRVNQFFCSSLQRRIPIRAEGVKPVWFCTMVGGTIVTLAYRVYIPYIEE